MKTGQLVGREHVVERRCGRCLSEVLDRDGDRSVAADGGRATSVAACGDCGAYLIGHDADCCPECDAV